MVSMTATTRDISGLRFDDNGYATLRDGRMVHRDHLEGLFSSSSNKRVCIYDSDKPLTDTDSDKNRADSRTNADKSDRNLAQLIRDWIEDVGSGWWPVRELDSDLGISGTAEKDYRGKVLRRLRDEGLVEQHQGLAKQFRRIDKAVTRLDFKNATPAGALNLEWPLGIHHLVNLYPGNLAVVAGAPNAGKTALLLDFCRLNMGKFPVYYWCSEMESAELRDRLELFPGMAAEDWRIEAFQRATDFEQVIVPDCINVVDYLEMTTDLYEVNTHLTQIQHGIGSGIAAVAIQKKTNAMYGRGQEFGLEKPKLYLSMDAGRLTIVKGKAWAVKGRNPNGLAIDFCIENGCEFAETSDWRQP